MSERTDREFLSDIREALERIRSDATGMTYESFVGDLKTQDAIIRNLEILGGVRDLRQKLSHYLDMARAGQAIAITENGKVIAQLVPAETDLKGRLEALQAGRRKASRAVARQQASVRPRLGNARMAPALMSELGVALYD